MKDNHLLFLRMIVLSLCLASIYAPSDAQEATPEVEVTETQEGFERLIAEIPLLGVFEYVIALTEGDILTVVAHDPTETVDVVLSLVSDETVIAENDNHETDISELGVNDAVLESIEIEADGEYSIRVDNNFYGAGEIEIYILLNEAYTLDDLFDTVDRESATQPRIELQERPSVRTTGPCTASVGFVAARLREAPVASAPQVATLSPGTTYVITGKVRGADNYVWYRLENYLWVRSDAVLAAGACNNVPLF